jgi:hypothetical protein
VLVHLSIHPQPHALRQHWIPDKFDGVQEDVVQIING